MLISRWRSRESHHRFRKLRATARLNDLCSYLLPCTLTLLYHYCQLQEALTRQGIYFTIWTVRGNVFSCSCWDCNYLHRYQSSKTEPKIFIIRVFSILQQGHVKIFILFKIFTGFATVFAVLWLVVWAFSALWLVVQNSATADTNSAITGLK